MARPSIEPDSGTPGADARARFLFLGTTSSASFQGRDWTPKTTAQFADPGLASILIEPGENGYARIEIRATSRAGRSILLVIDDGRETQRWTILIGDWGSITLSSCIVQVGSQKPVTNSLAITEAVRVSNVIFAAACVTVTEVPPLRNVVLPEKLEKTFFDDGGRRIRAMLEERSTSATITAFFVARLQRERFLRPDFRAVGFARPSAKAVFVQDHDTPQELGLTLAHEITHAMGALRHIRRPDALMQRDGNGITLTMRDILRLRGEDPSKF